MFVSGSIVLPDHVAKALEQWLVIDGTDVTSFYMSSGVHDGITYDVQLRAPTRAFNRALYYLLNPTHLQTHIIDVTLEETRSGVSIVHTHYDYERTNPYARSY